MRRPRKWDDEPDGRDRWLVSYADLMTLLFAFFVVMYAISSVNEHKYRALSSAMNGAFKSTAPDGQQAATEPQPGVTGGSQQSAVGAGQPVPPAQESPGASPQASGPVAGKEAAASPPVAGQKENGALTAMAKNIQDVLSSLVSQGKVKVLQSPRGLTIEINASVLFAPADAALSGESAAALAAVADILKDDYHAIQVEGHTDNVVIAGGAYPTNWELSSARAASVVRLFARQGVAPSRLTVIGRADNDPVSTNMTAEGRAANRRVRLVIPSIVPETVTELPLGTIPATPASGPSERPSERPSEASGTETAAVPAAPAPPR